MLIRLLRNQVPEKKTFFDSRRFKNCPAVWKWSDFDDCHRNSAIFFKNQRSFEHDRAPKRPTDTSEANSAQQNCPRCFEVAKIEIQTHTAKIESANRAGRGRTVPAPTIPRASRSSSHGEREPALRVTQMNAVLIQPIDCFRHPSAVPCMTAPVYWRRIGVKHTSGSQGRIKACNFSLVQVIP
jgi:phage FluMu protein Com